MQHIMRAKSLTFEDSLLLNDFEQIRSDDPRAAKYAPPAPVACEFCGKERYARGVHVRGKIRWLSHEPCD